MSHPEFTALFDDDASKESRLHRIDALFDVVNETSIDEALDIHVRAHASPMDDAFELAASNVAFFFSKHRSFTRREVRTRAAALKAGMELGFWINDVSATSTATTHVRESLTAVSQSANETIVKATTIKDIDRNYAIAMQYAEAQEYAHDCLPEELALLGECAERYRKRGDDTVELFKTGYGYIQRALSVSASANGGEYETFNLAYLGVSDRLAGIFDTYYHTHPDVVAGRQSSPSLQLEVLDSFKKDSYVQSFLSKGMTLSLTAGVCRLENRRGHDNSARKYHAVGAVTNRLITGVVSEVTVRPMPSLSVQDTLSLSTTPTEVSKADVPTTAGVYIQLKDAALVERASDDTIDRTALTQTVLIPLGFAHQQLLYHK